MTSAARRGTVSSRQRKSCFRVIEALSIDPRFRAVASLAAQRLSVGSGLRHAVIELAMMRVLVARRACLIGEMERHVLVRFRHQCRRARRVRFVASDARNRRVRALQGEARLGVHCDRELRPVEISYGMAALAAILVGRLGELPTVGVLMAVGAFREFDFEYSVCSRRDVALRTFH